MTKTTIELAKMIAMLERASSEQKDETVKADITKEIASFKKSINASSEKAKDILKMLSDERKAIKEMSASNFSKALSVLANSENLKSLESYKKPSFNWKNFTLDELEDMLPEDVMISHYDTPSKEFQRTYDNAETKKFSKNQRLTISDAGEVEISKGSENIYMEVKCYSATDRNDESEYKVTIYSKENHSGLKEVASQCIQKMAKGGSIKEKPMSSAFSNFLSKVKTTAKTGLKKGKDFTNKKIHDSKKKIAIDALKDAKKKVKQPEEKFILTQAVGIMNSKYAEGGNLPDSIPYKHSLEERKELQKEAEDKYAKKEITKAQYDKLMEEASARILKGYSVNVYENKAFQDPLAIAKGSRYVLVTDGLKGDSSTVYSNEPYLFLVKRNIFGNEYLHAEPVNLGAENKWKMFGGKFVFSSDSRFSENISRQPIGVHDRVESYAEGGSIPKGKIILASTGVPLKILKYDKSFGGRVLVERMDKHGKGVKGWMPVSKFKGQFEEGGRISEEELEALKEEYANEDIEILKKQHHLAITDTKKGVVWGMHDNGIFVFNDNKGGTFFTGPESEAKEFLKEVYSVEGEEDDDKMATGGGVDNVKYFFIKGRNEYAPEKLKDTYGEFYNEKDLIEYLNKWKDNNDVSFNNITKVYSNGKTEDVTDFYLKNFYAKGGGVGKKQLSENESNKIADNFGFNLDEFDSTQVIFSSRQYGNISSEKYGDKDLDAARKLSKFITENYDVKQIKIESVDEFVLVIVDKKQKFSPKDLEKPFMMFAKYTMEGIIQNLIRKTAPKNILYNKISQPYVSAIEPSDYWASSGTTYQTYRVSWQSYDGFNYKTEQNKTTNLEKPFTEYIDKLKYELLKAIQKELPNGFEKADIDIKYTLDKDDEYIQGVDIKIYTKFYVSGYVEDYAKGGEIYSSDEMYVLKVYDLKGNLLDDSKRFRERNERKAKEYAIDYFEDDMRNKYGSDLKFTIELAKQKMATGGSMYADGGKIYALAEKMTDQEYKHQYAKLTEKDKKNVETLIRLGDEPKLALATVLLTETNEDSETWNLYRYATGGSMYADGAKVAFLPPQGTMVTKDKSQKLDYKKISPDTFEFVVYDGQTNPMDGYSKTSFKKRNDGVVTMNYNQFVNYIKTEGYVDDSSFARGGSISTFEIGDWVQEKKGTARGQVYDKLGDFGIYLKDKYGNESRMLYFADRFKISTRPRYEIGGTMELEEEVFILPTNADFLVASVNYPLNNQLKDITGDGYNLADFTEKRFGNFFVMVHKSTGKGFVVYGKNVYDSLTEEEKSADLQMIRNLGIKIN